MITLYLECFINQSVKKTVDSQFKEQIKNADELKKIKIHEFRYSHASDCIKRL